MHKLKEDGAHRPLFAWLEGEMFLDRLKTYLYTINKGIVLFVAA